MAQIPRSFSDWPVEEAFDVSIENELYQDTLRAIMERSEPPKSKKSSKKEKKSKSRPAVLTKGGPLYRVSRRGEPRKTRFNSPDREVEVEEIQPESDRENFRKLEELMNYSHQLQQVEELQRRSKQQQQLQQPTQRSSSSQSVQKRDPNDRPVWDLSPSPSGPPENLNPTPHNGTYFPQNPVGAFGKRQELQFDDPLRSNRNPIPVSQIPVVPAVSTSPKQAAPPAPPPPLPNWALSKFTSGASGTSESFMNQLLKNSNHEQETPIQDSASAITDGVESQITWLTPPPTPKNLPTNNNIIQSPLNGSDLKEAIISLSPNEAKDTSVIDQCPVDDSNSNGEEIAQMGACYNFDDFIVNNANDDNSNEKIHDEGSSKSSSPTTTGVKTAPKEPSDTHTHPPDSTDTFNLADVKTPPELSLVSQSVPQNLNFSDPNLSLDDRVLSQLEVDNSEPPNVEDTQQDSTIGVCDEMDHKSLLDPLDISEGSEKDKIKLQHPNNDNPNISILTIPEDLNNNSDLLEDGDAEGNYQASRVINKIVPADTNSATLPTGVENPLSALNAIGFDVSSATNLPQGSDGELAAESEPAYKHSAIPEYGESDVTQPSLNTDNSFVKHTTEFTSTTEPSQPVLVQPEEIDQTNNLEKTEIFANEPQKFHIVQPVVGNKKDKTAGDAPLIVNKEIVETGTPRNWKNWTISKASWVSTVQGESTDEGATPTGEDRARRNSWIKSGGRTLASQASARSAARQPSWISPSTVHQTTDTRSNKCQATERSQVADSPLPADQHTSHTVVARQVIEIGDPSPQKFGDFGSFMQERDHHQEVKAEVTARRRVSFEPSAEKSVSLSLSPETVDSQSELSNSPAAAKIGKQRGRLTQTESMRMRKMDTRNLDMKEQFLNCFVEDENFRRNIYSATLQEDPREIQAMIRKELYRKLFKLGNLKWLTGYFIAAVMLAALVTFAMIDLIGLSADDRVSQTKIIDFHDKGIQFPNIDFSPSQCTPSIVRCEVFSDSATSSCLSKYDAQRMIIKPERLAKGNNHEMRISWQSGTCASHIKFRLGETVNSLPHRRNGVIVTPNGSSSELYLRIVKEDDFVRYLPYQGFKSLSGGTDTEILIKFNDFSVIEHSTASSLSIPILLAILGGCIALVWFLKNVIEFLAQMFLITSKGSELSELDLEEVEVVLDPESPSKRRRSTRRLSLLDILPVMRKGENS